MSLADRVSEYAPELREYVVDVKGFGHVASTFVRASSKEEAIALAAAKYDIEITVHAERGRHDKAYLPSRSNVPEVED